MLKQQLFKISRLQFDDWLFGPKKFSGLSRNKPQVLIRFPLLVLSCLYSRVLRKSSFFSSTSISYSCANSGHAFTIWEMQHHYMASNSQAKWSTLIGWFLVGILQCGPLPWKRSVCVFFSLSREILVERNRRRNLFFHHNSTIIPSGI